MMRVSTTWLESFRRVVDTPYGDEAELIDTIMGKPLPPEAWKPRAGTAWDNLLCGVVDEELELDLSASERAIYRSGAYWFGECGVVGARRYLGKGITQLKSTKVFDVYGLPVTVVGVADHMRGSVVQENKAKFSPADPGDYEPSLQWKFYCSIFGAACVQYNLWEFKEPAGGGYCELKGVTSFRLWPYVGMEAELRSWLAEFCDWAHRRKLTGHMDGERRAA